MKQIITNKQFREQKLAEYAKLNELITRHFEYLCMFAEDFRKVSSGAGAIDTPFGRFTFVPDSTFSYEAVE